MREEIGSEFWEVPLTSTRNELFSNDIRWFVSGTSALKYILEDINTDVSRSASLPSWCCSCMITPFLEKGFEVYFYDVYYDVEKGLSVDYTTTPECSVTLIMSYFGYSQINTIGKPTGIIIRDVTHSMFIEEAYNDANYYFGSLRKWMGVWTGGYAYKDGKWSCEVLSCRPKKEYISIRKAAMEEKQDYINGKRDDKSYLLLFEKWEDYLDQCGIEGAAERDIRLSNYIDVKWVRTRRKENASIILKSLKNYAIFKEFAQIDCPMFVPILINEEIRDGLRRSLISKDIYCPIHWPISEYHKLNSNTKGLYQQEISLVCDQRYNAQDMHRLVSEVKKLLR